MERVAINGGSQDVSTALLFTNNLGQVIFVDNAFLKLMAYPEAGVVAGEPLYKALGLDQQSARQFMESLVKVGRVDEQPFKVRGLNGIELRLICSGVGSYDARGSFIGADITLREVADSHKPLAQPKPVAEPVTVPIREVAAEAEAPEHDMFLELYFTSHIKALYVLMARLMGVQVHKVLDKIINETCQRGGWPVQIKNGIFATDLGALGHDEYRVLMSKMLDHAIKVIGQRYVAREMDKVDVQIHEGVLVIASQAGLRDMWKNAR
jgi:hypothetical protein